jgi:hypothetical protein
MSSLRESPIRRRKPARPPWLIALLVAVAVLVVVGIGYGVVSLVRGPSDSEPATDAAATPSACATTFVTAGEALPQPAKVTLNVYNATEKSGLASRTATEFESRGFRIGDVGNDPVDKPITGVAQIRYGPKGAARAELVLLYVPGAELVQLDRKGRKVDVAVGDAFTGIAPEQEVNALLASPSPVASGLGCAASGGSASPAAS